MNVATALKTEIARVARKEIRIDTQTLKKAASQYRSEIAALKRRVLSLERMVKQLGKTASKARPVAQPVDGDTKIRFSAKGFASQRTRLGLSAVQLGLILGVSDQSVKKWETGSAKPRAVHLPAIASLRTMGKQQAAARLAELSE